MWKILLEFPLYRLRRRIDAVILIGRAVIIVEIKAGERKFNAADRRQVEEYALDLRDFHEPSKGAVLVPVLWCTGATNALATTWSMELTPGVNDVVCAGHNDLPEALGDISENCPSEDTLLLDGWEQGPYRPTPTIIEAATALFAGHDVREIARADASNLDESAARIVQIVEAARSKGERALVFLTGVPGSGKTLAGLEVVHRAVESGVEEQGDIVYLSGNTPLVTVLREALALDEYSRQKNQGLLPKIGTVRNLCVFRRLRHPNPLESAQ